MIPPIIFTADSGLRIVASPVKVIWLRIGKLSWTTFYLGSLENKDDVRRFDVKPKFRIVDTINRYNISKEDILYLNQREKFCQLPFAFSRPELDIKLDQLTVEQALVQWMVQTRQPFTTIERPTFRGIFDAAGVVLPVRSADTFGTVSRRRFRPGDMRSSRISLTIASLWRSRSMYGPLTISSWSWPSSATGSHQTSDVGKPCWSLLNFEERSGENMPEIVHTLLQELEVAPKLLTITGDNASNNGTLCDTLYAELHKGYDDEDSAFRMQPLMRFHGRQSFIRCLPHVINLVCKEILAHLGAGSAKEAKATLDE